MSQCCCCSKKEGFRPRLQQNLQARKTSDGSYIQSHDVQASRSWRLCTCNSDIWDIGWVYHTDGTSLLAISCHRILISINQGELEHCQLKQFYPCVHKGQFTHGITKQQHHERILSRLCELAPQPNSSTEKKHNSEEGGPSILFDDAESLAPTSPSSHHQISREVCHKINLVAWLGNHQDDPALEVNSITRKLKCSANTRPRTLYLISRNIYFVAWTLINSRLTKHQLWHVNTTWSLLSTIVSSSI